MMVTSVGRSPRVGFPERGPGRDGTVRGTLRLAVLAAALALVLLPGNLAAAAPRVPMDLVWVVHAGPLAPGEPYAELHDRVSRLVSLATRYRARATILLSGDVAEEAITCRSSPTWMQWVHRGFEVGTYVPASVRDGPRRFRPVAGLSRFGEHGYDAALAARAWRDHRESVDRLVGARNNRAVEAEPFLCSTEAGLALENHLDVSFCRAGRWLFWTDEIGTRPWRPAASDEPRAELAVDVRTKLVEVDRAGQVGDPFDRGGDFSVLRLREAYLKAAGAPTTGPRTFAFLTRASRGQDSLDPEIARFVAFLANETRGNARRARWATAATVRTSLLAWETAHATPGGFVHGGPEPEPIALRVRRAQLDGIVRLRSGRLAEPTTAQNLELRWWALMLWRAVLLASHPAQTASAFSEAERVRLARLMEKGPSSDLLSSIDRILVALEEVAKTPPAAMGAPSPSPGRATPSPR